MGIQEITENEFYVENGPILQIATDVLMKISKLGKISLKAEGEFIPNAVSIANIINENFLKDHSKISHINLDSEISPNDGKMISNIEIVLLKY